MAIEIGNKDGKPLKIMASVDPVQFWTAIGVAGTVGLTFAVVAIVRAVRGK